MSLFCSAKWQHQQPHADHIEELHYLETRPFFFFVILTGRVRQSVSLAKERDENGRRKCGEGGAERECIALDNKGQQEEDTLEKDVFLTACWLRSNNKSVV